MFYPIDPHRFVPPQDPCRRGNYSVRQALILEGADDCLLGDATGPAHATTARRSRLTRAVEWLINWSEAIHNPPARTVELTRQTREIPAV